MYTIDDLMQDYSNAKDVFPLQTTNSLGRRWGVSFQTVQNWAKRDDNFPKPVSGLIEGGAHTNNIYPYYAIEEYEKRKGIIKMYEANHEEKTINVANDEVLMLGLASLPINEVYTVTMNGERVGKGLRVKGSEGNIKVEYHPDTELKSVRVNGNINI